MLPLLSFESSFCLELDVDALERSLLCQGHSYVKVTLMSNHNHRDRGWHQSYHSSMLPGSSLQTMAGQAGQAGQAGI